MPNNHAQQRQANVSFWLYAVLTIALLPVATKYYTKWMAQQIFDPRSHVQPGMSLEEYITLCADLHNQLMAKTIPPYQLSPSLEATASTDENNQPSHAPEPKQFEKTLLQRYHSFDKAPFVDYLDRSYRPPSIPANAPILSLLSQLQTAPFDRIPTFRYPDNPNQTLTPQLALTPLLHQPIPEHFFPELFFSDDSFPLPSRFYSSQNGEAGDFDASGRGCNCLLLYPQRIHSGWETATDGGIFMDMDTLRAIWNDGSPDMGPGAFPAKKEWVGLDFILRKELQKWEQGRYEYVEEDNVDGEGAGGARVRAVRFSPYLAGEYHWQTNGATGDGKELNTDIFPNMQVFEAIQQWDRLLNAIEEKMKSSGYKTDNVERIPPIAADTLNNIKISQFAKDFLTRARRPPWKFVAPGISVFKDETLIQTYANEEETSSRLRVTYEGDSEDWISLILPGDKVLGKDVKGFDPRISQPKNTGNSAYFDENWGFGQFTLGRRAGLYAMYWSEWDGDLVTLVAPSGNTEVGRFKNRCPWGPDRGARLAEILGHWAGLVERGAWRVGENGVVEGAGWFEENVDLGDLDWRDIKDGI
ncbi:hypothetical protein V8F20_004972 [Naviculisporaceae sp. PSN 640]